MAQDQRNGKQQAANANRNCVRWTLTEDRALVAAMQDLLDLGGWKADNGQFKNGAYAKLEASMEQKLPGCGMKAKPHIESRVKTLRKHFDAITEMLSAQASGFGWNDEGKFVTCEQSVWDNWVKYHKNAKGLRNRPFPLFDELGRIFGKDRANGNESGTLEDALEDMEDEEIDEPQEEPEPNSNAYVDSSAYEGNQVEPLLSSTPSNSRTKKARTETIGVFRDIATKLDKMNDVIEVSGGHIGRLVDCFKHESEAVERRMQVTSEIMKIVGLNPSEVLFAAKKIAKDPLDVDFFFSLPADYKYTYVQGLLLDQ